MKIPSVFAVFVVSSVYASSMAVYPDAAIVLPIPTDVKPNVDVVCYINNGSFPSSVEVHFKNSANPKNRVSAKINGNPLSENRGHLTREKNEIVFAGTRYGWRDPVVMTNADIDIVISVKACEVVD